MAFRVFGIRHHGPGSARRLRSALEEWEPDCVLVEGPADGQSTIAELMHTGLEPPVAMVLFADGDIENASFYPFARFSPEYQAIYWAHLNQVPFELIDLPAKHYLARKRKDTQIALFQPAPELPSADKILARRLRYDPLSLLAELANYSDSERWWDATIERSGDTSSAVFEALLEAIGRLRAAYPAAADEETLQREAYMRIQLRAAIKGGYERIAVVVGAWHGPALMDTLTRKAATDKGLLKGLPKVKIKSAWVPWSYPRLAKHSGYGAGVVSPAWYQLLFESPGSATERWMVASAQLLRDEGWAASPALAADGVQLAKTLAQLREQAFAGMEELDQAVLSTLAAGKKERLEIIRERLITGTKVGTIPPGITTVPLLNDLQKELKATRMTKMWEITGQHYLKANKTNPRGGIDLRQANDLRKSHLLHRLDLIGIPWGQLQPISANAISSFREIWLLEWQPEFGLFITERSSYGNTLASAAAGYTMDKVNSVQQVDQLAEIVLASLRANLPELVPHLVQRLRQLASYGQDTGQLLTALPTLVNTCRYGDSRKTDTSALLLLIEELVPRLVNGLPAAASNIDAEQAEAIMKSLAKADYALGQLAGEELLHIWHDGLKGLLHQTTIAPQVKGVALRLLYDRSIIDFAATRNHFHFALSTNQGAKSIAEWIGGFLYGSSQLLLHFPPLWKLLSEWVSGLPWEDFRHVLPLLRRSLSDFRPEERRKILQLVASELVDKKSNIGGDAPLNGKLKQEPSPVVQNEDLLLALRNWIG